MLYLLSPSLDKANIVSFQMVEFLLQQITLRFQFLIVDQQLRALNLVAVELLMKVSI